MRYRSSVTYPPGFDPRRAVQLAELVAQAYQQFDAFRQNRAWAIGGEYSLIAELLRPEPAARRMLLTQFDREMRQLTGKASEKRRGLPIGFLARRDGEAYLVFRGTMTTNEWVADLNVRLVPRPYLGSGQVHDGFLRTYELFRATILESLRQVGRGDRLLVTGHSLGAGLATLAAADVATVRPGAAPTIYTFASPRVGDRQFASEYNARLGSGSYRVANTCDMVVSVPFPVPFLGFIGGYFTHVDAPVDFTVQVEDAEKNHDLATYLEAMKRLGYRRGLLRRFFQGP